MYNARNFSGAQDEGVAMTPTRPPTAPLAPPLRSRAHRHAHAHPTAAPVKGAPFRERLGDGAPRPAPAASRASPCAAKLSTKPPASDGVERTATPRATSRDEGEAKGAGARRDDDPLDPMARRAAQLAPPLATTITPLDTQPQASATSNLTAVAQRSLEELLPALVRRVAWSGDSKQGTLRMELAAGALAGATLIVSADLGRVHVQMQMPPGVDAAAWRARIHERLTARGLDVATVEVA